ncbi:hypothetical protein [Nocardiopsis rhodophaea]|uniref:hypothetical protein n=1 Tax=Nocardiopsis rhodophaea TaxID=280238 RepID=UPI0031E1F819
MTTWPPDLTTDPDYENNRVIRVWAYSLYPAIRDMLSSIPKPIHLPHLNAARERNLDDAAQRINRALRKLEDRPSGLPSDLHPLLVRALRDTLETAKALGLAASVPWWTSPHGRLVLASIEPVIHQARARARAVDAYAGLPDMDEAAYWDDRLEQLTDHL